MSLAEAYKREAVERCLVKPLEALYCPKWKSEEQREIFISELAKALNMEDSKKIEGVYWQVINSHKMARFPTIAHILSYLRDPEKPSAKAKISDEEKAKRLRFLARIGMAEPRHEVELRDLEARGNA